MKKTYYSNNRYIRVAAALLSLVFVLSSCVGKKKKSISCVVRDEFVSLDPQIASGDSTITFASNCFEGLTSIGKDKKTFLSGAESVTVSNDGLEYTFKLRKGARWYLTNTSKDAFSDRLPGDFDERVTAHDFEFGLKRLMDPNTGSSFASVFSDIKNADKVLEGSLPPSSLGIKATDDMTLKIQLKRASDTLLKRLATPAAAPCREEFFKLTKGRYGLEMANMLCNGPFMLWQWDRDREYLEMRKNDRYNGPEKARLDSVWLYRNKDPKSAATGLSKGDYEVGYTSPEYVSLLKKGSFKTELSSRRNYMYLYNAGRLPFSERSMRMAFTASTNPSFITLPDGAEGRTDRFLLKTNRPYYSFDVKKPAYDEDKAKAFYKEALTGDGGVNTSTVVNVLTTSDMKDSVTRQVQNWQKVFALDVKIKAEEKEEALERFHSGDFDVAFLPVEIGSMETASVFGAFVGTGGKENLLGMKDEHYDSAFKKTADAESDRQKLELFAFLEQRLISEGYLYPVFTGADRLVTTKSLYGVINMGRNELNFRFADLN